MYDVNSYRDLESWKPSHTAGGIVDRSGNPGEQPAPETQIITLHTMTEPFFCQVLHLQEILWLKL